GGGCGCVFGVLVDDVDGPAADYGGGAAFDLAHPGTAATTAECSGDAGAVRQPGNDGEDDWRPAGAASGHALVWDPELYLVDDRWIYGADQLAERGVRREGGAFVAARSTAGADPGGDERWIADGFSAGASCWSAVRAFS